MDSLILIFSSLILAFPAEYFHFLSLSKKSLTLAFPAGLFHPHSCFPNRVFHFLSPSRLHQKLSQLDHILMVIPFLQMIQLSMSSRLLTGRFPTPSWVIFKISLLESSKSFRKRVRGASFFQAQRTIGHEELNPGSDFHQQQDPNHRLRESQADQIQSRFQRVSLPLCDVGCLHLPCFHP